MPVHDWMRVDAGTFHAFHTAWVTHLSEAMNSGLLPAGYYAMPEQHFGRPIADVLTLHVAPPERGPSGALEGGLALADALPKVSRRVSASPSPRALRRTLAVRHVSGHHIVALLEIVSPANKDRAAHVDEFARKAVSALAAGVHVTVVDLIPPGRHDPAGMHPIIWQALDPEAEPDAPSSTEPLTLVSYAAGAPAEAYIEQFAVGGALMDMPLFLRSDRYVNLPLERAYASAFRGMPAYWRDVLERGA